VSGEDDTPSPCSAKRPLLAGQSERRRQRFRVSEDGAPLVENTDSRYGPNFYLLFQCGFSVLLYCTEHLYVEVSDLYVEASDLYVVDKVVSIF
jgi:hypothetical protein